MFKIDTARRLLEAFRPRDRKLVELPAGFQLPVYVRDYLAWTHPAGGRVFLVFAVPGGVPTGIAFDSNAPGVAVPHLCDWCHCGGLGTQVAMLSTWATSRRRVGVQLCADLSCKQKLEDAADLSGTSAWPKVEQVIARMARFATEALKIDLTAAGR